MSKKSQKDEKVERLKVKKAIEQGNLDGARIYAQNAIRKKNEALNYLRLGSRIDAVAGRMQTAVQMNQVTQSMKGIVTGVDKVLQSMDPAQISKIMDRFEKQFDDMDVVSDHMEKSMAQSTSLTTPEDEVNQLMSEVADEHGLALDEKLGNIKTDKNDLLSVQQDELSDRLAKLKAQKL